MNLQKRKLNYFQYINTAKYFPQLLQKDRNGKHIFFYDVLSLYAPFPRKHYYDMLSKNYHIMRSSIRKHKAQTSFNENTKKKTQKIIKNDEKPTHTIITTMWTADTLTTNRSERKKGRSNQSESVKPADRGTAKLTLCIRSNRTPNVH